MDPHITIVTLGVEDVDRAIEFYRDGLGLPMQDRNGEEIAFFELEGAMLALYPWGLLAEDATVPPEGSGFRGVTVAHNVADDDAVDAVLAEAEAAGGELVKPGQETDWGGYSGYFADPDGHLWEVAWNPFL
ncbi:VOC family protein [Halorarum halobium]|uniref:VOC family protein n=1 Tax=Halorarum halobium TaxID=3075121 RepID=UPI0028A6A01C|nr:VOC family protein [Halobaculum sp. XH14]